MISVQKISANFVFSTILTFLFFVISFIGIVHHEIWLDEAHSFLIAQVSDSFLDLIQNSRQEGHPMIWYCILWVLNKFSHDVFYMQLIHISISCCTVFLMAFYGPFNRYKKILLAFSYYFFYEYNILSRNYSLCLLFVTIYCILISRKNRNYVLISCSLALLANTHLFGLILSGTLALASVILYWNEKEDSIFNKIKNILFPAFILLLAYIICIQHILPEETSMFSKFERKGYLSIKRFSSLTVILKGLFQFPFLDNTSWNTNIFTQNKIIGFALTIIITLISIKSFFNKPVSFLIFFSSVICFTIFFYLELMYEYAVRHWGFIFLAFYTAVWLAESLDQNKILEQVKKYFLADYLFRKNDYWRERLFYSSLMVQVAASIYMFVWDYNKTFCTAYAVTDYIKKNNLPQELIIVSNFMSGPPISAYLDKKLYYPECHGYGTYGVWNTWPMVISQEKMIQDIKMLRNQGYPVAILILNNQMYKDTKMIFTEDEHMKITSLKTFEDGFTKSESYRLYRVDYK